MAVDVSTQPLPGAGKALGRLLQAAGITMALFLAWLLIAYGGRNVFAPIGFLVALFIAPLVLRKPVLGLYILAAAAVAIETDPLTFGLRATSAIPFFHDLNGVTGIRGLWVNPAELMIVVVAVGWLIRDGAGDRIKFKPVPLLAPLSVFIAIVAFSVIHGLLSGGDIKIALWTVRPLAYFYLAYVLTQQVLTDRRQITVLLWILILGVALKGAIGWWRYYVDLGGSLNGLNQVTGMNSLMAHEESFFYLGIIFLAGVQILYGAARKQRTAALLATPLVLVPFLANQRRAGTLALMLGLVLLCFVTFTLLSSRRKAIFATLALAAVIMPFYIAVSWNAESLASEPVRAVKSVTSPDTRDLSSNEYRDVENLNLEYTVRSSPIIGIGFGKEMVERWPLPDISGAFAWYKIAPHNSVLWMMMTTGVLGFLVFWYFAGSVVVGLLLLARRLPERLDKGIAVYALLMLVALFAFALLDQGFLSMRNMTFMGILLGAVFALPRLTAFEPEAADPIDSEEADGE